MARKNKKQAEVESVRIKSFVDMIAPSVIKFFPDYFICGNTYRSVWALREYPTTTDEQAILKYLGEKDGVSLKIYARHVTAAEERKNISNAANKNRLRQSKTNDLQETVVAEGNLQDVTKLVASMHRNREPLIHTAVYIEMVSHDIDTALLKALYLATFEATKKWTMPLRNWGKVYGELSIMYDGRLF